MITITGTGFTVDGTEVTSHEGAPPIEITAGAAASSIRLKSSYPNVRNGGPSIVVQVEGMAPAILPPGRSMNVQLPLGRIIRVFEQ